MTVEVSYVAGEGSALISTDQMNSAAWLRIKQVCANADNGCEVHGATIQMSWFSFLSCVSEFAAIRRKFGVVLDVKGRAAELLSAFAEDVKRTQGDSATGVLLSPSEVDELLKSSGLSKRHLTREQLDVVVKLVALGNGANFSVPGAGKTTVALAIHTLIRDAAPTLMVVAPKNAFPAWDEAYGECFDYSESGAAFTRLVGGEDSIRGLLLLKKPRYLISYDQANTVLRHLLAFLAVNRVHLILDESHRIKAGENSRRGMSALRLAPLARRRDILSGTPIPNGITDISPQLDFLWPGQNIGNKIARPGADPSMLRPLYARITKAQLKLPPVTRHFVPVPMTDPQLALYSVLRSSSLRRLLEMQSGRGDASSARSSVMRLLQASTNPQAAADAIQASSDVEYGDDALVPLYDAVAAEKVSAKMIKSTEIAIDIAAAGGKTVIWSVFRDTIDKLESLLQQLSPVVIHGGIGAGSEDDPDTREGRVARFHNDSASRVLIANPAACSEGISLHRVCHNAIYIDRSYNAAHYLQSIDRIHRLGLRPDVETNVYILQSIAPAGIGSIDYSVSRRLLTKLRVMDALLDDEDIRRLALDEDEADDPIDFDYDFDDLADLLGRLTDDLPFEPGVDGA